MERVGRHPRRPRVPARLRRRARAAPRRRRAPDRRAGRPALGRLRRRRPGGVRPARGVRRPPGAPLDQAVGRHPRPRPARPRRPRPPGWPRRCRRRSGRASSTATTGWTTACSTRTTPGRITRRPRLGDVDARRPADRPRDDVRLLAGGRRGARVDPEPGDHAARLPDPRARSPSATPSAPGADLSDLNWYVGFAFFKFAAIIAGIVARSAAGAMAGKDTSGYAERIDPCVELGRAALDDGAI